MVFEHLISPTRCGLDSISTPARREILRALLHSSILTYQATCFTPMGPDLSHHRGCVLRWDVLGQSSPRGDKTPVLRSSPREEKTREYSTTSFRYGSGIPQKTSIRASLDKSDLKTIPRTSPNRETDRLENSL